jgi:hypothetical protein
MFPTELAGASAAAFHPESNTVDLPLPISVPILARHLGRRVVTRRTTPFSLQLGQCLTPNGKTKGPFEAKLEARTLIADRDVRLSRSRRRHGPLLSDREIISLETRYFAWRPRYLTLQFDSSSQESSYYGGDDLSPKVLLTSPLRLVLSLLWHCHWN